MEDYNDNYDNYFDGEMKVSHLSNNNSYAKPLYFTTFSWPPYIYLRLLYTINGTEIFRITGPLYLLLKQVAIKSNSP